MNKETLNKIKYLAEMAAHLPADVTLEDEDAALKALHSELAADTVLELIALADRSSAPVSQMTLTDEQIEEIADDYANGDPGDFDSTGFARAILVHAASQAQKEPMEQRNPHAATFPAEIWLNVGDGDAHEVGPYKDLSELSWCWESIDKYDVRYVRADLAAAAPQAQTEPVAIRWPNGRGKFNYADVNDTVPLHVIGIAERLYTAPAIQQPAVSQPQAARVANFETFSILEEVFANAEAYYKVKIDIDACNNVVIRYDDMDEEWSNELRAALDTTKPNADCSGDPTSCPDNEGYGCACDPMNKASTTTPTNCQDGEGDAQP